MIKTYMKRPKFSQSIQRRSHSLVDPYKPAVNPKIQPNKLTVNLTSMNLVQNPAQAQQNHQTIPNKTQAGLNNKFLYARRQNFLNTGYNNRKQRLQHITAENRQIHHRINSQKSAYSRDEMNKSYENSVNISRRLSQSKISRRSQSSSRASMRSTSSRQSMNRNQNKFLKPRLAPKKYQINAQNVTTMKKEDLKKMSNIFNIGVLSNQNAKPYSGNNRRQNQSINTTKNYPNKSLKTVLPPIAPPKKSTHTLRNPLQQSTDGDFLHRIAEQMYNAKR